MSYAGVRELQLHCENVELVSQVSTKRDSVKKFNRHCLVPLDNDGPYYNTIIYNTRRFPLQCSGTTVNTL